MDEQNTSISYVEDLNIELTDNVGFKQIKKTDSGIQLTKVRFLRFENPQDIGTDYKHVNVNAINEFYDSQRGKTYTALLNVFVGEPGIKGPDVMNYNIFMNEGGVVLACGDIDTTHPLAEEVPLEKLIDGVYNKTGLDIKTLDFDDAFNQYIM